MKIQFGIDTLLLEKRNDLRGLRVGLVTNSAATTAIAPKPLTPTRLALQQAGVNLVKLFSPEHGLAGHAAEGDEIADEVDVLTGLPVYSLYGATLRPTAALLRELDLLLFDIPDIGARFYTYIWTLSYVLEACAEQRLQLWVLDRPNPLSGDLRRSEGPMLDEAQISTFVGRWTMPVRHSLTSGELACLWNQERALQVVLTVAPVQGWVRSQSWSETELPFLPTSPNIPNYETVLLYPGTCLFEGTNLSEGRGTTLPFRVVGAPWLNSRAVVDALNELALPGVMARAVTFTPTVHKYAGQVCQGVMLHVVDASVLRPVAMGLHLLWLIRQLQPEAFQWAPTEQSQTAQPYNHFDRLIGRRAIRGWIEQMAQPDAAIIKAWTDASAWQTYVAPHLLYP
ncbi:MAG: DUF1343 domain-containing protein [Caldilineaceae bacterium]